MIKRVPARFVIDDDSFPYNFSNWNYPTELLHSCLYSAWWTEIPEDENEEYALVMDYDGFIEWYNSNPDKWMTETDTNSEKPLTAEEYLPYHLGKTLSVIKIVEENYIP